MKLKYVILSLCMQAGYLDQSYVDQMYYCLVFFTFQNAVAAF